MIKKTLLTAVSFVAIALIFESCFYHKGDEEYPASPGNTCDTNNVRFSVEIKSILDANCQQCHDGTNSISGIDLYNYSTISGFALDGQFTYGTLLSAVKHEGGAPMMPDNGGMLPDCDINKIAAWVHAGAPDN